MLKQEHNLGIVKVGIPLLSHLRDQKLVPTT